MTRKELTEKKAARVRAWLLEQRKTGGVAAFKEFKNFIVVVTTIGTVDAQAVGVDVFSKVALARWFDEANLRMRTDVIDFDDAMTEAWPVQDGEAGSIEEIEEETEKAA